MKVIETELRKQVTENHSPSVQYACFDKDHLIHRYTFGLADVGKRVEAKPETTYHGFSTTKTFTALAILQLAEQGMVDINEPAIRYFRDFDFPASITIKNLLNHTAGIPNPIPLSWIHLADEHKTFDRDKFFDPILAKNSSVKSKPNDKFTYSNLGFILLGQLIENVSGTSYERYVEKNIIKPLGLGPDQLGFLVHDANRHARGYHKKNTFSNLILGLFLDKGKFMGSIEGAWKPFKDYYLNGAPYGGLIGTTEAYVTYLQELLKSDSKLISPAYKQMLFTENHTNNGKSTGMCLSWYTGVLNGHRYYCHAGGGGGYYCEIRIYPEKGVGSVIMFNRTGMTDERFLDKVDRYL
ncbi:MAG TPA: serine hydrolase domain-containing protein [Saprospiraceae bacterium]